MVSEFIDATITMTPALFKSRQHSPIRAGQAFTKLHDADLKFNFRFELFNMIDEYLEIFGEENGRISRMLSRCVERG